MSQSPWDMGQQHAHRALTHAAQGKSHRAGEHPAACPASPPPPPLSSRPQPKRNFLARGISNTFHPHFSILRMLKI